jgi:hypothetical protein
MATFGFPADSFAQSVVHAREETAPAAPIAPHATSEPSASSPSAPRDKRAGWEAPAVMMLAVREAA